MSSVPSASLCRTGFESITLDSPGRGLTRGGWDAPSRAGPTLPAEPHQLFPTLESLNTGALSASAALEFGPEREAVPGPTGSRTLELLFLLADPQPHATDAGSPRERPLGTPQEGAASPVSPPPRKFAVARPDGWISLRTPRKLLLRLRPVPIPQRRGHSPSTHGGETPPSHPHRVAWTPLGGFFHVASHSVCVCGAAGMTLKPTQPPLPRCAGVASLPCPAVAPPGHRRGRSSPTQRGNSSTWGPSLSLPPGSCVWGILLLQVLNLLKH